MEPKQHLFSLTEYYDNQLNHNAKGNDENYSDLMELMIIMGKSLVTSKEQERLWVDVPRLKRELVLWKYYRNGNIQCFLLNKNEEHHDFPVGTGIISLLPLIMGNFDGESLEKEMTLFALETNQSFSNLIMLLLMGKTVHGIMHRQYSNADSVVSLLKEYLIHLNYEYLFPMPPQNRKKNKIEFEKAKIQWIMDLDRTNQEKLPSKKPLDSNSKLIFIQSIYLFGKYHENPSILNELENLNISAEVKLFAFLLRDLKKQKHSRELSYSSSKGDCKSGTTGFVKEMDRYFNKLKGFEIEKKPLNTAKEKFGKVIETKELFSMEPGEKGKHSILKEFEVTKKEIAGSYIKLHVRTKTRLYKLKKPLAQG